MKTVRLARERGVAIIMMITILLLAVATYIVSQTPNSLSSRRAKENSQILGEVMQALQGYALTRPIPGGLPCPDTTGDGLENPVGLACASQLGLVPFRTLGLDAVTDATGAYLWYAVALQYVSNAATLKNSSLQSTMTLDGNTVGAVVIAPGPPVDSQGRTLLLVTDFLEGMNADADLDDYSSATDDSHNDQVLALTPTSLWTLVESRAVSSAVELLDNYRQICGEYPWAAAFGGPFTSIAAEQEGSVPVCTALPYDWGSVCPGGVAPVPSSWLSLHWAKQMFYRMCTFADGNCVTVSNSVSSPAAGVIVAPGVPLSGQTRPSVILGNYYEDENANGSNVDFKWLKPMDHSATFNDTTAPLLP